MGYAFVVRKDEKRVEVARVTNDLNWTGDEMVIARVKAELKLRNLDLTKAADFKQIPFVFSGSYFWAAAVK